MDEMLIQLSSQGISVQPSTVDSLFDEKKTLFVVRDIDDAITTEKYTSQADLNGSKVNHIWVHHHQHKIHSLEKTIKETDIHLYSLSPGLAVAHLGNRLQGLQRGISPTLNWSGYNQDSFRIIPPLLNQQWVEKIERAHLFQSRPFLENSNTREYDRALIVFKNFESSALRDLLIQKYNIPAVHIDCLSLHRWKNLKLLAQFEKRGIVPDIFRGLLILSAELSQHSQFEEHLANACSELTLAQKQ